MGGEHVQYCAWEERMSRQWEGKGTKVQRTQTGRVLEDGRVFGE